MNTKRYHSIPSLVAALSEVYQPIYGHPEIQSLVSRACDDRFKEIKAVYQALTENLGRPLKVLDLGCAQGYISFNLAALGSEVVGIDNLTANIAICNALRELNPKLKVQFEEMTIESKLKFLEPGNFDIVIGLSVFHHLCHQHGKEKVREMISSLMTKVEIGIFELALAKEPLYWAKSLPKNERYLLKDVAFAYEIGRFQTHLSEIFRPMYICSNRYWYLNNSLTAFYKWTWSSHPLVEDIHQGSRRYYFSEGQMAKVFLLSGDLASTNLTEIEREADFLTEPPSRLPHLPQLIAKGRTNEQVWLVRDILKGDLLIDLMKRQVPYDSRTVIMDVLDQLCILEESGLYHSDVRAWNIVLGDDKKAYLIDFGSIFNINEDCVWPKNLMLSFFIFIRDVSTGSIDYILPLRQPFISPYNIPPPFKEPILNFWNQSVELWSFNLLRDNLRNLSLSASTENTAKDANALWMQAIEQYLDDLNRRFRPLNHYSPLHIKEYSSDDLLIELNKQSQRITTLEEGLSGLREQEKTLQESLSSLRYRAIQLETELAGVYRSRSWRLTAPLRIAKSLATRFLDFLKSRQKT